MWIVCWGLHRILAHADYFFFRWVWLTLDYVVVWSFGGQYVHRKIAKAADETRLDLKIQGILLSIQHTANKTLSTYKRMRKIQTDFGTMLANIQRMRSQLKGIKQKPCKRHLARSPGLRELGKDESHGTSYEDTNAVTVAQGNSPPPVKVALDAGSSIQAMHNNETSDTVHRLGTARPMISAMTSPMSVSPHIKTPLSLLANTPAALTKMDKIDPLISTSDALDMKDLHSRVYVLQSRITSTLQQTKVAREKTRTILLLRRAEVSCLCFRVCVREDVKRDEGRSLSISWSS